LTTSLTSPLPATSSVVAAGSGEVREVVNGGPFVVVVRFSVRQCVSGPTAKVTIGARRARIGR
jgi:hypothetical protein